jgi:hypothetical protein
MKRRPLPVACVLILLACSSAFADDADREDLKIAECISRHLNERFIGRHGDVDLGIGVIADPHVNDAHGYRGMSRMNVWHAESLDLTIIVGDASAGSEDDLNKYIVQAPKNFSWPYTGRHVTIQARRQVERRWPDKPRPAPPCILAMGNHEIHLGKRTYVELLYPGAVKDTSLWIHRAHQYFNKAPGPNGNGNYVFFAFDFGKLHLVALDAWGRGTGGVIPPHELKWLQADLNAHRDKETLIFNHAPIAAADPNLQLRNKLELMSVLSAHPQVKWYFSGHHHGYAYVKWAHVNVLKVCGGEGRYGSGALLWRDGKTSWRRWGGHYWYAPEFWKDKKQVMYHRTLVPDEPTETVRTAIPKPAARTDDVAPAAPANLRIKAAPSTHPLKGAVLLEWDPADGADYYDVHRDGRRIGGSLYPYCTDPSPDPKATHTYAVYARDLAGNRSASAATGENPSR